MTLYRAASYVIGCCAVQRHIDAHSVQAVPVSFFGVFNMSYNGWSNRETWLVNVWFNPESRDDVLFAQSCLEEQYNNIPEGPLKDMIDLSSIDWEELLQHFSEEEEESKEA